MNFKSVWRHLRFVSRDDYFLGYVQRWAVLQLIRHFLLRYVIRYFWKTSYGDVTFDKTGTRYYNVTIRY